MKVAASPQIYKGRCPKVVFKSPVTSHFAPLIPIPWPLIPAFKLQDCGGGFAAILDNAILVLSAFPHGEGKSVATAPRSFGSGHNCSGIRYLTYDVSHRSG